MHIQEHKGYDKPPNENARYKSRNWFLRKTNRLPPVEYGTVDQAIENAGLDGLE